VVAALPFGIKTTAVQWEAKTIGLAIIFVYAFFKFAWAYRLYNYVAILVGATPPAKDKDLQLFRFETTEETCAATARLLADGQVAVACFCLSCFCLWIFLLCLSCSLASLARSFCVTWPSAFALSSFYWTFAWPFSSLAASLPVSSPD